MVNVPIKIEPQVVPRHRKADLQIIFELQFILSQYIQLFQITLLILLLKLLVHKFHIILIEIQSRKSLLQVNLFVILIDFTISLFNQI
jgi:hypothetical protein